MAWDVRCVAIRPDELDLTLHCNNSRPSCASRRSGAPRKINMDIVAFVMLGSVALWLLQHLDTSTP
jgi:F0F1-type ATP synthase assembly protein I